MKVIAFLNKKGGCGKSTLICALGTYWAERKGKHVAVQDMEVGGLSGSFVKHIDHPNLSLYEPGQDYDYVLIDTEGNLSNEELAQIEEYADQVIIPIKLTAADIKKLYETSQQLSAPKKARVLINLVRTNTTAWRDREHSLKAIPLKQLKSFVKLRSAYEYLLVDGWPAIAHDRKAFTELETLAGELS